MYHILVVEDDQDINRLLCRILTDGGYDVRPAFSGSEAVLWAEQYDYDLVLLDLMLPGLTGEEFIAQMRKKKTMPILVLSAKAGLEDRVNVLRLGADDFIPKPFDNAEVLARVEAQLRRYKQFSAPAGSGHLLGNTGDFAGGIRRSQSCSIDGNAVIAGVGIHLCGCSILADLYMDSF